MNEILEKLKNYGADVDETCQRFVGDEGLYIECLHSFVSDESFTLLGLALKNGNLKEAFEQAHGLKGISANLGLTNVYQAISIIVEELRANKIPACNLYEQILKYRNEIKDIIK